MTTGWPGGIATLDDPFLQSEWLEADGLGGFASGTVGGPRTRRYHALLLTATKPPTGRLVLVNGVEAWLTGHAGSIALTTQRYRPDVVDPRGYLAVSAFRRLPWPRWRYGLGDGAELDWEIFVCPDTAETVLRWSGGSGYTLWVRPLLSGRDQHALHYENADFRFAASTAGGNVSWRPYDSGPAVSALSNGDYDHDPRWYRQFLYTQERDRGMVDHEDLAAPGVFRFDLSQPAVMILRAGDGLAVRAAAHAEALARAERRRRSKRNELEGVVAGSYLVDRGHGRTVLAGFPWFSDWGRDSFISLRGLCLTTGRFAEAQAILLEWADLVSQGMLPNRFPDDGGAPEYNAVDASLWFIVAVHDFLVAAAPTSFVENRLAAAVHAILTGYEAGTRFGIRLDDDGLVAAGVAGVQLTWMDAKCGDWVVTPRIGKPVEVQALWINAVRIGARWDTRWGIVEERARASFIARFLRPDGGLFDVVDVDHEAGVTDAAIRPNQIFAVGGLPFAVVDGRIARSVVLEVERALLTPMGLRTLAPTDPAYRGRYVGTLLERDGAYHQGTVWPWLLGAFVQAWLRVNGDTGKNRAIAAERFVAPLTAHLELYGLGHVCEVADGDAPHRAGGCPFQAWSVGEYIRMVHAVA